jgi:hypothetical protein
LAAAVKPVRIKGKECASLTSKRHKQLLYNALMPNTAPKFAPRAMPIEEELANLAHSLSGVLAAYRSVARLTVHGDGPMGTDSGSW